MSGSGRVLRTHFRQFAEWVFGPGGIASVWVVIFGDFSYGGRKPQDNLLLCRDTAGGTGFRLLQVEDKEWIEVQDAYRSALEACPSEQLLEQK